MYERVLATQSLASEQGSRLHRTRTGWVRWHDYTVAAAATSARSFGGVRSRCLRLLFGHTISVVWTSE